MVDGSVRGGAYFVSGDRYPAPEFRFGKIGYRFNWAVCDQNRELVSRFRIVAFLGSDLELPFLGGIYLYVDAAPIARLFRVA